MGNIGKEASYAVFLILSLLTYVAEISLNCLLAYYLWTEKKLVWFALLLCLIIVPCIVIQLVSYHQQTVRSKGTSCIREVPVVLLHIFQLALPWRYGRLLLSHRVSLTSREIWEGFFLRVLHTFFSTMPVFVIQVYLILAQLEGFNPTAKWYLVTSASTSILSIAWILATYQKYREYCCVVGLVPPWTAIVIKLIWRIGELFSRILTLGLFAVAHEYWLFLVIGFHWLTMLLVLIVDRVLQNSDKDKNLKFLAQLLLKSYMYIFTHLNITSHKARYGFVFFYIICCLESVALLTLWVLYETKTEYHIPFGVAVAGGYALAVIFALIYYNCFHKANAKHNQGLDPRVCQHQCADCRLEHCGSQISGTSSSKPWLQVTSNPNPQFFDMLQSSDCNSDRSSEVVVNGITPAAKTKMVKLDARTLNERSPARSGLYSNTQNSEILEWDDYDLQIRETPEGASLQDRDSQIKESPRSSTNSKGPHSRQTSIADQDSTIEVLDSPRGTLDQGYFSGISASSLKDKNKMAATGEQKQMIPLKLGSNSAEKQKEPKPPPPNTNEELLQSLKQHKKLQHHHHTNIHHHIGGGSHSRQHSGSGVLSDTTTASAYSSASSKRPILNCERCGHCVAIDSVSLYSVTSTSGTSMASSHLYGKNNRLRPGSVDMAAADRSAVLKRQQKRSKSQGNRAVTKRCAHHTELQLPMNVARHSLYAYTNPVRIHSDATSSGWECTDSEI